MMKGKRSRVLFLCCCALFLAASYARPAAPVTTYYVATWGNDIHPGDKRRPFATVQRALQAVRNNRGAGSVNPKPATLFLYGGEYHLDRPIVLYGADSNLTLTAFPGERAVLSGSRPVTQWKKEKRGLWSAGLDGFPNLHLLVVNRQVRPWARLPQEGTLEHDSVFSAPWMSTTGGGWKEKPTLEQLNTLKTKWSDLLGRLDVKSTEVRVYHMWDTALVPLAAQDTRKNLLTFGVPCEHPPGAFGVRKYVLFNLKGGMTKDGNWYQDRAKGRLYYRPLPGETMEATRADVPVLESILRIEGDRSRAVSRIILRDLTLTRTNTPVGIGSFGAQRYPGAVEIQHARDCRLERLQVIQTAGHGIRARNLEDCVIRDCDLLQAGACGILVSGKGLTITGNRILQPGSVYPSAIGLYVVSGSGNLVSRNEVKSAPYDGMVVNSHATLVEQNLIENVMQELHDGAGLYTGFCRGVTLRGNVVRDIRDTGGYGASAYYIDENGEDDLVEGNLSLNVVRPSHNHMARRNVIRGNVFVSGGAMTLDFPRCGDFSMEGNILASKGGILVGASREALTVFKGNVLFPGYGRVEREFLEGYAPRGRMFWEPEGNRFEDPGIDGGGPDIAEVFEDFPKDRWGIDPDIFRKAGCGR